MPQQRFQFLFYILQSEQSIIARTYQKVYALLSVVGSFMVSFITFSRMEPLSP